MGPGTCTHLMQALPCISEICMPNSAYLSSSRAERILAPSDSLRLPWDWYLKIIMMGSSSLPTTNSPAAGLPSEKVLIL